MLLPQASLCFGKDWMFATCKKTRWTSSRNTMQALLTHLATEAIDEYDASDGGRIFSIWKTNATSRRVSMEECTSANLENNMNWLIQHGVQPSRALYACLLQQCGHAKALAQGKRVHAHIVKSGHEGDRFLGNFLVRMYGKCGALDDARAVFANMMERNVFSWTIMIGAYVEHGQRKEAFQLFQQMQLEGVAPNKVTLVSILSACASREILAEGKMMHALIVNSGFELDLVVCNALVNMYGKSGSLEDAQRMFDKMVEKDVISWTAIIAAYAQHGEGKEALRLFLQMQVEGMMPNKATFLSILSACAKESAINEGKQIHARIVASGLHLDISLGNALVNMYAKCRSLHDARQIFETMSERNIVSWNAMITAYSQHGRGEEAIQVFKQMQLEGVAPNKITFICILHACASQPTLLEGKRLHADIISNRLESDVAVGTALVNMYGKCGSLKDARRIFDKMPKRDVLLWNAMIAAYSQHRQGKEALQLFGQMQWEDIMPDIVTFVSILDACTNQGTLAEGKLLHSHILERGFESNVVVGTALVHMYGKCGSLEYAQRMFDKMAERNMFSWSAMIAAYAQHGQGKEALSLFQQMLLEGVMPDKVTFVSIFDACTSQANLADGKCMHAHFVDSGFKLDVIVGNSLVNMYGKCGSLQDAWRVFDKLPERNVVSWTSMIAACAEHGQGKEALQLFVQMELEGILPDSITFISILSACSHAGLVVEGCCYFVSMIQTAAIIPTVDHINCMVDLLGRAGQLAEGEDLINNMPFQPTVTSWMTLLGACRIHFDVERGKRAAECGLKLDSENATLYALLSNMYSTAGWWGCCSKVKKMMEDNVLAKEPVCR